MQLPHDSYILVADGRKMLFFRNEGDADYPNLQVVTASEQRDAKDREMKTDAPGRTFDDNAAGRDLAGPGASRSGYEETDFHQLEEDRFAADAAAMLRERALRGEYEALVVVAPPHTLGELRKHYHKEVERRLLGELAKDLTGHPTGEIEKILIAS